MAKIQRYKARITGTEEYVIGNIVEIRKYLGDGCYANNEMAYLMAVSDITMPNGKYGSWIVDEETIEPID